MPTTATAVLQLLKHDDEDLNWGSTNRGNMDILEAKCTRTGTTSPVGVETADYVGQLYRDSSNGEVWIASFADSPGLWTSLSTFSNPFSFLNTLTVNGLGTLGAAQTDGLLTAAAGLEIFSPDPPTSTLLVPDEEVIDNGVETMNPLTHGGRHAQGEVDGVTFGTTALAIPFVSSETLWSASSSSREMHPDARIALNHTTRTGDSLVYIFMGGAFTAPSGHIAGIYKNLAPITALYEINTPSTGGDLQSFAWAFWDTAAAQGQTNTYGVGHDGPGITSALFQNAWVQLIDFGEI